MNNSKTTVPFIVLQDDPNSAIEYVDCFYMDSNRFPVKDILHETASDQKLSAGEILPTANTVTTLISSQISVGIKCMSQYVTEEGLFFCLISPSDIDNNYEDKTVPAEFIVSENNVLSNLANVQTNQNDGSATSLSIEDRLANRNCLLPPRQTRRAAPKLSTVCNGCHRRYVSQSLLKKHINLCKLYKALPLHIKKSNFFVCTLCKQEFARALLLKDHMRYVHEGEKPLKCHFCEKRFYRNHDLKIHLNIHLNIKNYICDTCGQQFNHLSNLKRHQRMHSGICPYVCHICKQRFKQIVALNNHYSQHKDKASTRTSKGQIKSIRKCYCQACGKTFRSKLLLAIHEKEHHSTGALECLSCFNKYESLEILKNHSCAHSRSTKRCKNSPKQRYVIENLKSKLDLSKPSVDLSKNDTQNLAGKCGESKTSNVLPSLNMQSVSVPTIIDLNTKPQQLVPAITCEEKFKVCNRSNKLESIVPLTGNEDNNTLVMYLTHNGERMSYVVKKKDGEMNCTPSSQPPHLPVNNETIMINVDDKQCNSEILLKKNQNDIVPNKSNINGINLVSIEVNERSSITCHINEDKDLTNDIIYVHSIICNNDPKKETLSVHLMNQKNAIKNLPLKTLPKLDSYLEKFNLKNQGCIIDNITHYSDKQVVKKLSEESSSTRYQSSISSAINKSDSLLNKNNVQQTIWIKEDLKAEEEDVIEPSEQSQGEYPSASKKLPTRRSYNCPDCGKDFSRKWNYEQHCAVHYPMLHRYKCDHCNRTFAYRSTFSSHLATHDEKVVKFPCQQCPKLYNSMGSLRAHDRRVHLQRRTHQCSLCPRAFSARSELDYHMRLHLGEQPYVCYSCGRTFAHSSHLHRHERLHSGERPHKCAECPATFIQAVGLAVHTRSRHQPNKNNSPGSKRLAKLANNVLLADKLAHANSVSITNRTIDMANKSVSLTNKSAAEMGKESAEQSCEVKLNDSVPMTSHGKLDHTTPAADSLNGSAQLLLNVVPDGIYSSCETSIADNTQSVLNNILGHASNSWVKSTATSSSYSSTFVTNASKCNIGQTEISTSSAHSGKGASFNTVGGASEVTRLTDSTTLNPNNVKLSDDQQIVMFRPNLYNNPQNRLTNSYSTVYNSSNINIEYIQNISSNTNIEQIQNNSSNSDIEQIQTINCSSSDIKQIQTNNSSISNIEHIADNVCLHTCDYPVISIMDTAGREAPSSSGRQDISSVNDVYKIIFM